MTFFSNDCPIIDDVSRKKRNCYVKIKPQRNTNQLLEDFTLFIHEARLEFHIKKEKSAKNNVHFTLNIYTIFPFGRAILKVLPY